MDLDNLLGIDLSDPLARRARRLQDADRKLIDDLVARRKQLDLTQAEVARRMDTSQAAVARIESGIRDVHQSTLRRYAMAVEAVVEHRVVADDRGNTTSSAILRDLKGQLEPSPGSAWSGQQSVDVDWTASARRRTRKVGRG